MRLHRATVRLRKVMTGDVVASRHGPLPAHAAGLGNVSADAGARRLRLARGLVVPRRQYGTAAALGAARHMAEARQVTQATRAIGPRLAEPGESLLPDG